MVYLRVIDTGANDGLYNMALDEALFESLKMGGPPTLRFYQFLPPAITIGWHQKITDINLNLSHRLMSLRLKCKSRGIQVIRRPTGGRAVFHKGDLTYSLTISEQDPILGGNSLDVYKKVGLAFSTGLKTIGVEAQLVKSKHNKYHKSPGCFSSLSRYELQVAGKKILGSAQRREDGFILQQGTIPINTRDKLFEEVRPQEVRPQGEKVIGLSQIMGCNFDSAQIMEAIKNGFKAIGVKIGDGTLTLKERKLTTFFLTTQKALILLI